MNNSLFWLSLGVFYLGLAAWQFWAIYAARGLSERLNSGGPVSWHVALKNASGLSTRFMDRINRQGPLVCIPHMHASPSRVESLDEAARPARLIFIVLMSPAVQNAGP
jgi:hypothetical protein